MISYYSSTVRLVELCPYSVELCVVSWSREIWKYEMLLIVCLAHKCCYLHRVNLQLRFHTESVSPVLLRRIASHLSPSASTDFTRLLPFVCAYLHVPPVDLSTDVLTQPVLCLLLAYENIVLALSNVLSEDCPAVLIGRTTRGKHVRVRLSSCRASVPSS